MSQRNTYLGLKMIANETFLGPYDEWYSPPVVIVF